MADYFPIIKKAVSGLQSNTGESRQKVYESARAALVRQLGQRQPPPSSAAITKERLGLEAAIRQVELEQAESQSANSVVDPLAELAALVSGGGRNSPVEKAAEPSDRVDRVDHGSDGARKIFISYRREDSSGHAGRLHDRLAAEFGAGTLFMDVDAIPLGSDFVKVLRREVARCDVLLAVIGPRWLQVSDEHGHRRLDDPLDPVRIEIGAALQRDIPVIPILLEDVSMPKARDLPADLKGLASRNGLNVRHASFHPDTGKLIRFLSSRRGYKP